MALDNIPAGYPNDYMQCQTIAYFLQQNNYLDYAIGLGMFLCSARHLLSNTNSISKNTFGKLLHEIARGRIPIRKETKAVVTSLAYSAMESLDMIIAATPQPASIETEQEEKVSLFISYETVVDFLRLLVHKDEIPQNTDLPLFEYTQLRCLGFLHEQSVLYSFGFGLYLQNWLSDLKFYTYDLISVTRRPLASETAYYIYEEFSMHEKFLSWLAEQALRSTEWSQHAWKLYRLFGGLRSLRQSLSNKPRSFDLEYDAAESLRSFEKELLGLVNSVVSVLASLDTID
ncbi:hypothetical protein BO99DRAFT_465844 [Aspergillus violaceofuscus CBS 115571]|uniref:Uncharacterized protein n=1 Tax=Aspergillus violaceofuscus (strain CBS 115571) TaxID=1450538 RepID=A0A2V5HMC0_ASPV1|nr:hypothetical protein BO99DRAFT_465844 [Aspergillus violaceofuscus CBS 115571]